MLWVKKYKPHKLSDIIGQDDIIENIRNFIDNNNIPNMLIYGHNGTGKTSLIHAICNEYYGNTYYDCVLDFNASDDRGIKAIRSSIKKFVSTKSYTKKIKLVILDEFDNITIDAQYALRRIIENFSSNVRFCFICNFIHKIIPSIISRCVFIQMNNISIDSVEKFLINKRKITNKQKINLIYTFAGEGDLRQILTFLQYHKHKKYITFDDIYEYFYNVNKNTFMGIESAIKKKIATIHYHISY